MKYREEVIGDCRLILGDCLEVMPTLGKVDAVVTDPPFGLAEKLQGGSWGKKFEGKDKDWDAVAPDLDFISNIPRVIWGGNYFTLPPSRGWLIWYKRDAPPSMSDAELAWTSFDKNVQLIDQTIAATNAERIGHPTQKPVKVMLESIKYLPFHADTILDPFMGSGTTGVACAKLGRKFIGIELEERYFSIACKRIEAAYKQGDLFISPPSGKTEPPLLPGM